MIYTGYGTIVSGEKAKEKPLNDLRQQAEFLEREVAELRERLDCGQVYTASRLLDKMRGRIYWMQCESAKISPKAAWRWGNGVRMPDGTMGIIDWGL